MFAVLGNIIGLMETTVLMFYTYDDLFVGDGEIIDVAFVLIA